LEFYFLLLLFLSAFFSGAETALFSLSALERHQFEQSKSSAKREVVKYLRKPREILGTILLGNELSNVWLSIIGAALVRELYPGNIKIQTLLAVMIITPIILTLGEIIPKTIAQQLARQLAPLVIIPLKLFHRLVSPFRLILSSCADAGIRLFGGKPEATEPMIMEQEFRRLVDIGKAEGELVEEERQLIHQVFEFTEKVVRDIMTSQEHLFMLPVDISYERMLEEIRATNFSRIPIYEKDRNHVIGILHVRDLFGFHQKQQQSKTEDIRSLLHTPIFVKGDEALEPLLRKFQEYRVHMAIVVNEKHRLIGIVTMHDVLVELFGEMKE